MHSYELNEDLYIVPTPAGAYYAVSTPEDNQSRLLLQALLSQRVTQKFNLENLKTWTLSTDEQALDLVYHMQSLGWIEGLQEPISAPEGTLEDLVPVLLPMLSSSGKALLADTQGFYIASKGFAHETAEELSALSADIASLYDRHSGLLKNNLGLGTSAWALVNAAGNSQVGFWPLFIGDQRFVLVVGNVPRLNQPELRQLIWALNGRYGEHLKPE